MPMDARAVLLGHGAAAAHAAIGGTTYIVVTAVWAGVILALGVVFAVVVARHRPDPQDDEGDSGHGGGGGRGPGWRPPSGGGPAWWPEFERQFAAYTERVQRGQPDQLIVERFETHAVPAARG